MRLEDDEKVWQLTENCAENQGSFKHQLLGHKHCFLELCVACPDLKTASPAEVCKISEPKLNTCSIQAELVAEGWGNAMNDWKQHHQLPPRFDACPAGPARTDTDQPKPNLSGAQPTPFDQ